MGETAAVKRAVRTWRPGKGCGRGAAREGWSGVGKTGKWWMRQRWTRACLLALQWIERSTARRLDQTTITLATSLACMLATRQARRPRPHLLLKAFVFVVEDPQSCRGRPYSCLLPSPLTSRRAFQTPA